MTAKDKAVKLRKTILSTSDDTNWLEQELKGCKFKDKRLGRRFKHLCKQLWTGIGETIPFACQDWSNTKAAYRFLSNDRTDEHQILKGHFQSTQQRFAKTTGRILVLHDTTEFSYQRNEPELIGKTKFLPNRLDLFGNLKRITKCGILMHSSLAITSDGLPLGLAAIKLWTRKKFKGTNALKKHINPTRIPIHEKESYRWLENIEQSTQRLNDPTRCVHVGDRESDIYELFCMAEHLGTHFLVRTCVDRLAGDGNHTLADEMDETRVKGLHRIDVQDKKGNTDKAILEIKYRHLRVLPPIGKQKKYTTLWLTVIHAEERGTPRNRERISWKLITNLPVSSRQEAIEKLNWYAQRWKIETFHKILKSGCKTESSKLRTAERLAKLIAVFCILSWRIFWMTMLNRSCERASPALALTSTEIILLDQVTKHKRVSKNKTLSDYLIEIAKLGGYLARTSDPPPGNQVMWRGLSRLTDIQFGFNMAMEFVGN